MSNIIKTTHDAQGRAQISYDNEFMRVNMTQGGDPGGNSAWVQLVIEADQPVEVRTNEEGHAVIRITGTQEIRDFLEFIEQAGPQIDKV